MTFYFIRLIDIIQLSGTQINSEFLFFFINLRASFIIGIGSLPVSAILPAKIEMHDGTFGV